MSKTFPLSNHSVLQAIARKEMLEDVIDLLDHGASEEEAARRVGRTPGAVAIAARKEGLLDLSRRFSRLDDRLRRLRNRAKKTSPKGVHIPSPTM